MSADGNWALARIAVRTLAVSALLAACGDTTGGPDQPNRFVVGGTTSGLLGTVVLRNNGGDDLTLVTSGTFTFSTPLAGGSPYAVTVHSQPAGQTCLVANGSGTIAGADVGNVLVTCATNTFTVGGVVSGLSGTLELRNNSGDPLLRSASGPFTFPTSLPTGTPYAVTVGSQPAGQACLVTNGSGSMGGVNVTNVAVDCVTTSFSIGGTVSGLLGEGCMLQNNGGDDRTLVSGATAFAFPTLVPNGTGYAASIATQPIGPNQACALLNSSGTVAGQNVNSIALTCSVIRPDCSAATLLGSIGGDVAGAPVTATGTGEGWFRVRVREDDTGATPRFISAGATLTSPAGANYDLFVYCTACGGSLAGSIEAAQPIELVNARWEDNSGVDDQRDILIHVRYAAGHSSASWSLSVQGGVAVSAATCGP
jgi:hypothetical protein